MPGSKGGFQKEQRSDRLIHEHVHDPYRTRKKIREPAFCSQCSAVYSGGRWQWRDKPVDSHKEICPACNRINDKCPAGIITIKGEFLADHKEELIGLVKNEEKLEKGEHPLHRIIEMSGEGTSLEVTTTDIHLPRRIGEALHNAYKGKLDFHYEEETYFIRVGWSR
ncbi:MAG: BCAM0308 family protein [Deltaproteobacteria bacterium]|nr:BCAM0308 family protein [Deltaproteobacteria bacterium]